MTRVSWGQSFAFGFAAIGVPWAVVVVITVILLTLNGSDVAIGPVVIVASGLIVVVAAVIAAIITHRWQPLNRIGAGMHAVLACVLAIVITGAAISAILSASFIGLFGTIALFGGGVFLVCGGAPWAVAGGVLASRTLQTRGSTRPRWAPAAWILFGMVAVIVAVFLMNLHVPGEWGWFPLGRRVTDNGTPSWLPTIILANGLGIVALGAALWATREPRH